MTPQEKKDFVNRVCDVMRNAEDSTQHSPSMPVPALRELVVQMASDKLLMGLREPLTTVLRFMRVDTLALLDRERDIDKCNAAARLFVNSVLVLFGGATAYATTLLERDPSNRFVLDGAEMCTEWARKRRQMCGACGKGWATKKCARCRTIFYCGPECQTKHWKEGHRTSCIAPTKK